MSRFRTDGTETDHSSIPIRSARRELGSGTTEYTRREGSGLSDYTSKRLEELRARRAELESDYKDYKFKRDTSSSSLTSKDTDSSEYRSKRTGDTGSYTSSYTATTTTASSAVTSSNTSVTSSAIVNLSSASDVGSRDFKLDFAKRGDNKPDAGQRNGTKEEDDECVGFATLPDQVHRKAIRRGFDFTLMVVGEAGLGKSTLISSLFLSDLYKDRLTPNVEDKVGKTVDIEKKYMEIEEKGVKLRLTIVDTPGFNDPINAEDCWKPIENYINQQFDQYFKDESGVNRKNIKDNRVHCCLYFISPYGHGLRQIDVTFMKRLHDRVNIVPIIAKSDTLTPTEIKKLKAKILDEISDHNIKIYEFPDCDSDEDEEFKEQDRELKQSIPFAVVGSNTVVDVNGRKVRGRHYPWGIVEVDNPSHCDFLKLRQMLISTHMQDLKDVTRDIHYENYRAVHIAQQLNQSQRERKGQANDKLKRDSSPSFDTIMDTDSLLEQKDEEIRRMQEMIVQMQEQLKSSKSGPAQAQLNGQVHGLKNL